MPARAVLFDLGGTILDTADPIGWAEAAAGEGIVVAADHLAHAHREVEAECDRTEFPAIEEFWLRVLERASSAQVSPATANAFIERCNRRELRPPLFSDARYCLETLEGEQFPMGIVSNSRSEEHCRQLLRNVGVDRFFATIVSSGTEGVRKPSPEIFLRAVRRLGVPAGSCIHVGDLAHLDAEAAAAAGLYGVWLNRYGWGFGEQPPEITSLTELPRIARGFSGRSA